MRCCTLQLRLMPVWQWWRKMRLWAVLTHPWTTWASQASLDCQKMMPSHQTTPWNHAKMMITSSASRTQVHALYIYIYIYTQCGDSRSEVFAWCCCLNSVWSLFVDPDLFLKSARLQRLPSSTSDLASHNISPLRETTRDPLAQDCACTRDSLTVIIISCLTFATGVTMALIMQIYFGEPQVRWVTTQKWLTALGFTFRKSGIVKQVILGFILHRCIQ